ncbi:AAA-domain-containing protein [Pluteus cervinus]|uniref:AAA-domain-containing protein n=1 Tax=Pluteus cervinus TaxID=181527 RepID=A0ACD3B4M8_9AGAR|nr:AAA-domain-containing protein [Pluteus cervinus]
MEPVQQGLVGESTQFILISSDGHDQTSDETPGEDSSSFGAEGLEIDEAFLANPVNQLHQSQSRISFQARRADSVTWHVEEYTVYACASDLVRLSLLNGDWAIASCQQSSSQRLVRVGVKETCTPSQNSGTVVLSSALLFNLNPELASREEIGSIYLAPGPFGSHRPTIPKASSVVIARVASPVTTTRGYSKICFQVLRDFLQSRIHLVKQGDIFGIPVLANRENQEPDDVDGEDWDVDFELPDVLTVSRTGNELAFFVFTNIEYDISVSRDRYQTDDPYIGCTMGELGCWVDTSVTRIIQAGVEHSWIPPLGTNLELGRISRTPQSAILGASSPFQRLHTILAVTLSPNAVDYNLNLSVLLRGGRGSGKFTVSRWVAHRLGMHVLEVNSYDLLGNSDVATEAMLRAKFEKAIECSPSMLVLRHLEAFAQSTQPQEPGKEPPVVNAFQECITSVTQSWKLTGYPVVVVGTTSESERVAPGISTAFKHEILFEAPTEAERLEILDCLTSLCPVGPDVALSSIAVQTAGLVVSDLVSLVSRVKAASLKRASKHSTLSQMITNGLWLTAADFELGLALARATHSRNIGAPSIPKVSWDDVGGLAHTKADILDTIQLPLDHPELFAGGLKKRSGILLYGPPGTGKTLLAKAVATSCSLNFFSVKGPELLNMYIGESEANVRRVFQRARDARPCVIFFDELDSVAPKRGNHGDSGGVMDRIVSQLLAELDGMAGQGGSDVFVVGATNRPDLLDPALLRPGRFDRMIYLGVNQTHQGQYDVLEALTRKFRLDPSFDLRAFANSCPFNYTGADFYALCADALLNAMTRRAQEIEKNLAKFNQDPKIAGHPYPVTSQYYLAEIAKPEEITILVTQEDFESALQALVPSVSAQEMKHYGQVQRQFSQGLQQAGDEQM